MRARLINQYQVIFIILLCVGLNMLLSFFSFKADLTDDRRFSIGSATKNQMKNLNQPVSIDILLTGEFPASFKKLQSSTSELLQEMKSYAGPNLKIRFVTTSELLPQELQEQQWNLVRDSLKRNGYPIDSLVGENPGLITSFKQNLLADTLERMGIMPYTLQVQQSEESSSQRMIFPAALVSAGNKTVAVDLLSGKTEYTRDPLSGRTMIDDARTIGNAEAMLEFKFASAIEQVQQKQKIKIGYLTGNGQPEGPEIERLIESVSEKYLLIPCNLQEMTFIPASISSLLIVKPTIAFSEKDKLKIDQYVMQGGKLLWFIDQLYAESDSLALKKETIAFDRGLNLDDLLFKYGVRINRDLLQDLQCDFSKLVVGFAGDKPQFADVPFPYYPLLNPSSANPVTRNLDMVLGAFTNTMDTVKATGVTKTILLSSSMNAKTLRTPAIISLDELKTYTRPELYTQKNIATGVLLEGAFTSLYANRTPAALQDSIKQFYGSFRTKGPKEGCQFIAGDGDLVMNEYTREELFPMGFSRSDEKSYANKQLLENLLGYMTGLKDIIALRNREIRVRLLDKAKLSNQETKSFWQLINILAPLLLLVSGGYAFAYWRRKKYQHL